MYEAVNSVRSREQEEVNEAGDDDDVYMAKPHTAKARLANELQEMT